MKTKIIEGYSEPGNYGKFMLGIFDSEWDVRSNLGSTVPDPEVSARQAARPLLQTLGWTDSHFIVFDIQTGEGGLFRHGGLASADLNKHKIWVCPLFEPFLQWVYSQDLKKIDDWPLLVKLQAAFSMQGYRREGK
jgi:hypothetical protein